MHNGFTGRCDMGIVEMTNTLTPRHIWLPDRTRDCITELHTLDLEQDYDTYRKKAKELAEELLYAVTEWENYYNENIKPTNNDFDTNSK